MDMESFGLYCKEWTLKIRIDGSCNLRIKRKTS